jgi:flagellar assembly protein FliH
MPTASSPTGLAGFNLDDLSRQAQQKLTDCRTEVARMLDEARAEADRLRTKARAEGLEAGRKEAKQEADRNLQAALQQRMGEHANAVRAMVNQIAEQHNHWMRSYAETLVALVVEVSERVIRNRLDAEPEILLRWAMDGLVAARSAQKLTVAVHPETLAELGADLEQLLNTPGLPEDSSIVPDESVARTGVIIRQLGGEVDGGLAAQLFTLRQRLEEVC